MHDNGSNQTTGSPPPRWHRLFVARERSRRGVEQRVEKGATGGAEAAAVAGARTGRCPLPWWQRLGVLGFCFFLIKGLLWLLIPAGLFLWRWLGGE